MKNGHRGHRACGVVDRAGALAGDAAFAPWSAPASERIVRSSRLQAATATSAAAPTSGHQRSREPTLCRESSSGSSAARPRRRIAATMNASATQIARPSVVESLRGVLEHAAHPPLRPWLVDGSGSVGGAPASRFDTAAGRAGVQSNRTRTMRAVMPPSQIFPASDPDVAVTPRAESQCPWSRTKRSCSPPLLIPSVSSGTS